MAKALLWVTTGVTALVGAAALIYLRTRKRPESRSSNQGLQTGTNSSSVISAGRGSRIPGLRKIIRERKMVFVVNRPLLSNKQLLFVSVSTACIRYYRSLLNNREYYQTHVKPWTRSGQMKVVLKANNGDELRTLLEQCQKASVEAMILTVGDFVPAGREHRTESERSKKEEKTTGSSLVNHDPETPVILCVLASSEQLDQITGHLKLLEAFLLEISREVPDLLKTKTAERVTSPRLDQRYFDASRGIES